MRSEETLIKYSNNLVNDYLHNFNNVADFFKYNPYCKESFSERAGYLDAQYDNKLRQEVVKVLSEYNLSLGAGNETLQAIELLANPQTLVVVTGQQAGLFGGPLYSLYKALTAIQLSTKMSAELARPVVPVFWVAAEDHDFDEINAVQLLDKGGSVAKLELKFRPAGKFSIGDIEVPSEIEHLIDEFTALSMDTEFKDELLNSLHTTASKSPNLADWFARIILEWLGPHGLIMLNPCDKRLRALERGVFEQALNQYQDINRVVNRIGEQLEAQGYKAALKNDANNVNLFTYPNGERLALREEDGSYKAKGLGASYSKDELSEMIKIEPERFSPNVVLRPLTQDILLPTLAYIGGPGEIHYYAQLAKVYELVAMKMPIIYPRANITLVEKSCENHLNKYCLTVPGVLENAEELGRKFLDKLDVIGIDEIFDAMEIQFAELYAKLISDIAKIDSSLDKMGNENKERILSQINWLRDKTAKAHRNANDVFVRQYGKLCNNLLPDGQFQERMINTIYFSLKYGPDFFTELAKQDLLSSRLHKLIYLR